MTSARTRRTAAALGLAALALGLTACGSTPAGAASVVGSQTVSQAAVATVVDELRATTTGIPGATAFDEAAATQKTLERMTRHLLLEEAAVDKDIVVSQTQVDDVIAQAVQGQFNGDRAKFDLALAQQDSVPPSQVEAYARDFLISNALLAKAGGTTDEEKNKALSDYLTVLSDRIGVTVSPRFGTWVPASAAIGPVPDDLSTPAGASTPEPTPTATATPSPASS